MSYFIFLRIFRSVFFAPYFEFIHYDQETIDLLSWTGYSAIIEFNTLALYSFFAAYSITFLGMMFFKLWAKKLFLILLTISILLTATQGVSVLTAMDSVLSYLTNLADGATIILMYFTSVSSKFSEKT